MKGWIRMWWERRRHPLYIMTIDDKGGRIRRATWWESHVRRP